MLEIGYKISKTVFPPGPQAPIAIDLALISLKLTAVDVPPDQGSIVTVSDNPIRLDLGSLSSDRLIPEITLTRFPLRLLVSGTGPHTIDVGVGSKDSPTVDLTLPEEGSADALLSATFDGTSITLPVTGDPIPLTLSVENETFQRRETLRASVPFASGTYTASDLDNLIVSGHSTSWLPLQYWSDNSIKVAQAQFTDTIEPESTSSYTIASAVGGANNSPFERHPWVTSYQVGAEVNDNQDHPYYAFASDAGEVVQSTAKVRTKRHRVYHESLQAGGGIGRDFLTSMFYITEFSDMPFVVVDWIVGNDYSGTDSPGASTDPNDYPLGHIDVNHTFFLMSGATEINPYKAGREGVYSTSTTRPNFSHAAFQVFSDQTDQKTYIADGSGRKYRFLATFIPPIATVAEEALWNRTRSGILNYPMFPLASFDSWNSSKAAGLLGGPIPGPSNSRSRAISELNTWKNANYNSVFGTWGTRTDTKKTEATGTPRNRPLTEPLAHAIQSQYHPLIEKLEQMAWIQAARPYHLYGLEMGDRNDLLLFLGMPFFTSDQNIRATSQYLGRKPFRRIDSNGAIPGGMPPDPYQSYRSRVLADATGFGYPNSPYNRIEYPHDWRGYDWEHFTVDLLFDYFTLTGDPWAKEELRQLGQSLISLMRLPSSRNWYTESIDSARGEGWTMQALVQCYLATQDESLKTHASNRLTQVVEVERKKDRGTPVAVQGDGVAGGIAWPTPFEFYMPWQHGAILYGYLGAHRHFGDEGYLTVAESVPNAVEYAWLSGVTDPNQWGLISNGIRYYQGWTQNGAAVAADYFDQYYIRIGEGPLAGSQEFLIGGLLHLSEITNNSSISENASLYGRLILQGEWNNSELPTNAISEDERWYVWKYLIPDSFIIT
jgi:hypothetical protein